MKCREGTDRWLGNGSLYTIAISVPVHDTDNGMWKVGHPMADALLGYGEHDVINIETPQGTKAATILGIQRADRPSTA